MAEPQTTPTESASALPHRPSQPLARDRLRSLLATALAVAKNAAFLLYLYCGYVQLRDRVLGWIGRSRIVVLTYHRVGSRDVLSKPTEEFRRDLQYLKRHYQCMTLAQVHERLRSNLPIRRPLAVVTFDDGYRDNFTDAVPVLLAEGVPATFFVATGFIETDREFPHDQRAQAGHSNTRQPKHFPKLNWQDLRAMEAAGFEIGSHTVNHTNLGCADDATINRELADSLGALRRLLGDRPRAFSFPWGKPIDLSESAFKIAEQLGYYAAASAYGGSNRRRIDLFHIRRLDAGNGHLNHLAFCARLAGFDPEYLRFRLRHFRLSGSLLSRCQQERSLYA